MTVEAWSKSSLKSLLEGCAWQWALQKIGGLPSPASPQSAAGTGIHHALETHEFARIEGRDTPSHDEMLEVAMRVARAEAEVIGDWGRYGMGPEDMDALVTNAMVGVYDGILPTLNVYTPVSVEPYFRTDVGGVADIHGYIDWFGKDDTGRWTVVDYKTASSFSRWTGDMTRLGIEAAVYLAGAVYADILPADETVRMEWHVVKTKGKPEGRVIRGPEFTPDLLFFLGERLAEAEAMVAEKRFNKNTSWNLCSERWCEFYHGCEVTGVLAPESVVL